MNKPNFSSMDVPNSFVLVSQIKIVSVRLMYPMETPKEMNFMT